MFVSTLLSFRAKYHAAPNEFQKSTIRRERAQTLSGIFPSMAVSEWIGTISSMQTTSDGKGVLSITPLGQKAISIRTWNNGLSDISSGTLIAVGSSLYEQVSRLSVGERVFFSGQFHQRAMDYLEESSLTEEGSMEEPEFIFTFETVRPSNETH